METCEKEGSSRSGSFFREGVTLSLYIYICVYVRVYVCVSVFFFYICTLDNFSLTRHRNNHWVETIGEKRTSTSPPLLPITFGFIHVHKRCRGGCMKELPGPAGARPTPSFMEIDTEALTLGPWFFFSLFMTEDNREEELYVDTRYINTLRMIYWLKWSSFAPFWNFFLGQIDRLTAAS